MGEIVKCIDVSHWQGFPDFWQVAAGGTLAVIHKCTEGVSYVDDTRATNLSNAKRAGLAIATYHWLSPGNNAEAQIDHYLSTLDPVRGERVVIDYEQDGVEVENLHKAVQALLDADMDLQITVYSGHTLKEQLGDNCDDFLAENTSLWLAHYTSGEPSWPAGTWPQWSLWQYTDKGHVDGVDGYCDCNRWNGSDAALLAYINPAGTKPPRPTPPDETTKVTITIAAPANVKVDVILEESES